MVNNVTEYLTEKCWNMPWCQFRNPPLLPIPASALFLAVWTGSNFRQSTHSLLTSNVYLCIEASCKILIKFRKKESLEILIKLDSTHISDENIYSDFFSIFLILTAVPTRSILVFYKVDVDLRWRTLARLVSKYNFSSKRI